MDTVKAARTWWGKEGEGRNVYEAALDRTRYVYDNFDDVFVWFSGGKDSTATMHVVLEVAEELGRLPLRVVFIDEECITTETVDYVRRVSQREDVAFEWWCLPVLHRNACSAEHPIWWPWAPEAKDLWVREMPPEALTELAGFQVEPPEARISIPEMSPLFCDPARKTAGFMGIRAGESMVRRRAVGNNRPDNWVIPNTPWYSKAYPVYDWTTEDIWTAPNKLGWDYNASYDVMEMMGLSHFSQRCAPPFGEEPMQQLGMWAECFPDIWDKMCARVPGAATAARYSRTELYSFHGISPPSEELFKQYGPIGAWQEHIKLRLADHEPKARAYIAWKLKDRIRRHYTKTTDPIMPTSRHPISTMSWEYLYQLADRGDFKDRRQMTETGGDLVKMRAAYDSERAFIEGRELGRE